MSDPISVADQNLDGERRYLTILFSDLVGSTEIAAQMDPEEWRALMARYETVARTAIGAYAGHVAQFRGDGVLAYFGWPKGHENAAEGAVRAGLSILRGLAAVNAASPQAPLLLARIGIHSGPVVVSRGGDAYGDAANVAARIQAEAAANSLLVSGVIAELTSGLFQTEACGSRALRGLAQPIDLFRVLAPAQSGRKPQRRPLTAATRFVGRAAELDALASLWADAQAGQGRIVGIVGEPGVGKSRLVQEFRARAADDDTCWLEGGGAQLFSNTPFFAVADLVRRTFPQASPDTSLRHQDVIDGLLAKLAEAAGEKPAVLVIEDLHWVDPSTLEFLQSFCTRAANLRLLTVLTCRPGYDERLRLLSAHNVIEVAQLAPAEIRQIVTDVVPDHAFAEAVIARVDGVPLFAEEVAHLFVEQPNAALFKIPRSLADLFAARLDGLGAAREVAHTAAVVGDDLPIDLVRAITEPASDIDACMNELVEQRIVRLKQGRYVFQHALVREAAYETLLKSRRRQLHKQIAAVVTERFATLARERPEFVAQHWTAAEEPTQAAVAWREAGASAVARGAFREAHKAYEAALGQLHLLPESGPRDEAELAVQRSLAAVLQITRGYSSRDTMAATARAQELANRDTAIKRGRSQLSARWAALSSAGRYEEASALADELMTLARAGASREKLGEAHMVQMTTRYRLGDLLGAERFFRTGFAIFTTSGFRNVPGAIAQTFGNASRLAWIMGNPQTAARRMRYAVLLAERRANPYDVAFSLYMDAILHVLMQKPDEAQASAQKSIALSREHGFPQFATISRVALGRAYVDLGRAAEGIPLIEEGIEGMNATGSRVALTLYVTWLAEAQAAAGVTAAALATLERALSLNTQEQFFRAETLRLRAGLLAEHGRTDDARRDLEAAIRTATGMDARCFELRARLALHRLMPDRAALPELAALLGKLPQWLSTPDIAQARALLGQITASSIH